MKNQKKFKFLFLIFAFLACLLALVSAPYLTPFLLGGVMTQGILGGFSGKVGPVVGGKWKDIDYMRGYVVPSNPNSINQQAVRTKFGALVAMARQILSTVLQPYWDMFYTNQSGFNAWISTNYATLDGSHDLSATSLMSKGTLEDQPLDAASYATATGALQIEWTGVTTGNALADDNGSIVVYDKSTNLLYQQTPLMLRGDPDVTITIPAGLTASNLRVFVFFFRGTGSALIVSDSKNIVPSAV